MSNKKKANNKKAQPKKDKNTPDTGRKGARASGAKGKGEHGGHRTAIVVTIVSLVCVAALAVTAYTLNLQKQREEQRLAALTTLPATTAVPTTAVPTTQLPTQTETETQTTEAPTETETEAPETEPEYEPPIEEETEPPSETEPPTDPPFVSGSLTLYTEKPGSSTVADTASKLEEAYPSLVSSSVAGQSVMGNDIILMKVGTGSRKALIVGGIHAREYITINYLLLCVDEYCEAYMNDGTYGGYNMRELLDMYTLYIIPDINPDGTEISLGREDPLVDIPEFSRSEYKANANGVDLNRNFPLGWSDIDNEVYSPENCYFKGYEEASEPETQLLMSLCEENSFEFAISFHVAGECVYWGDKYDTTHNSEYKAFAKKITRVTDFYLTNVSKDKDSYGGGFENWFRHTYSAPGLCVELMSYKDLDYPVRDSAFTNFKTATNWEVSRYVIPAALS